MYRLIMTLLILAFPTSCKKDSSDGDSGGGDKATVSTGEVPSAVSISGTLQLSEESAANNPDMGAALGGKNVELVDDTGNVLAQAPAETSGAFTIQVVTDDLSLTQSTAVGTSFLRLRSIFLVNGTEKEEAVGFRKPIIIDPAEAVVGDDGTAVLDTGRHQARKVGAIVGSVTLETGEDPTGITVFVPGTTHIAKTDSEGRFLLGFLPRGSFDLRVDRDGFNSLEWESVQVLERETTHLEPAKMTIATGPKIESFALKSLELAKGSAIFDVKLKSASKYRISKLQDFSDAVFKPVDTTKDAFSVTVDVSAAGSVVTVYLEAADNDGLSANSSVTIDREAPKFGKLAIMDDDGLISTIHVPLLPSAEGADQMRFATSVEALQQAEWIDYSNRYDFTLEDQSEGEKVVFVTFKDEAGNLYGASGEISAVFRLDLTAPESGFISLYAPESPSGAFNKQLTWTSAYTDKTISFEVEVDTDSTFGSVDRRMTTSDTTVAVSPPLSSEGVYYWRVRAVDAAGNASDWVNSGTSKRFEVRILAEAFQSGKDFAGAPMRDIFFGRHLAPISDLTGDGIPEVAVSIASSEFDEDGISCIGCGVVEIWDVKKARRLDRVAVNVANQANAPTLSGFGHRVEACDLIDGGPDELVISDPVAFSAGFSGGGKVYVFEWDQDIKAFDLVSSRGPDVEDGATGSDAGGAGFALDELPYDYNGFQFGYALACYRKSGADEILIGEPGGYDSDTFMSAGRVHHMRLQDGELTAARPVLKSGESIPVSFGAALVILDPFTLGSCSSTAPSLAVGAPRAVAANGDGKVYVYQDTGSGFDSSCEVLESEVGDPRSFGDGGYGGRLFNLGNIDKNTDGSGGVGLDRLAVSSTTGTGSANGMAGVVRIFGGATDSPLKSIRHEANGETYRRFGYYVAAFGDLSEDGQSEIAISAPEAQVSGKSSAGKVFVYEWSDLDDDASGDTTSDPYKEIIGEPRFDARLGAQVLTILDSGESIHDAPLYNLIASPSGTLGAQNDPIGPPGVVDPGIVGPPAGFFGRFAQVKLKPGSPIRMTGTSSGAMFGRSILAVQDMDHDTVRDILVGEPGGRCDGRPYGAFGILSMKDRLVTHKICAQKHGDTIGQWAVMFPESKTALFSRHNHIPGQTDLDLFAVNLDPVPGMTFFDFDDILDTNLTNSSNFLNATVETPDWSFSVARATGMPAPSADLVLVGHPSSKGGATGQEGGVVRVVKGDDLSSGCQYKGVNDDGRLGSGIALIPSINGDSIPEFVFGEPGGVGASTKGRVYVVAGDASDSTCDISMSSATILATIDANDTTLFGSQTRADFGTYVLGLPDFDGAGPNEAYILVSNVNLRSGINTGETPQYAIIGIQYDETGPSSTLSLAKIETSSPGSGLGGFGVEIPDVNGDSVPDFALSAPGGTGAFGQTGQVRIYSGAGIATTGDASDDILQVIYNPDPQTSNFGIDFGFADVTGDKLNDFIIGADGYDSSAYQDAGAVYVLPMESIKE